MLTVTFDWLEFTVLDVQLPQLFEIVQLEFEDFKPLKTGRFGYKHQMKWTDGNIFIMFNALKDEEVSAQTRINPKSGIHVMITGQGCKQYSVKHSLLGLVHILSSQKRVNFSRIDLAIDDYKSEILNFSEIHDAAMAGNFTSRWSKWDEINSRQTSTNDFLGRTMYFGSQASDLFCRIYDKTLERKANADEKIETEWTRLEMVYRKDRAEKLISYIIKGLPIGDALRGTLKQYLRFLTPSADSNKARWPTAPWWDELLSNVEKLTLTIEKEAKTIEDMTSWVDRQIAPTMAAILKAHEGDLAWFRSILVKGSERLSQKHKDAISQYKAKEVTA